MFAVFSVIMVVSGVAAVLVGLGLFVGTVRFLRVAEGAAGVVVGHEAEADQAPDPDGRRRCFVHPVVEFADRSGRHHRVTLATGAAGWRPFPVGARVEILCPPDDPARARIRGFLHLWSFPVMFTACGLMGWGAACCSTPGRAGCRRPGSEAPAGGWAGSFGGGVVMRYAIGLVGLVLALGVPDRSGGPRAAGADPGPSPITPANYEKVKAGEGKLTEAEVVKLLGPARRARNQGPDHLDLVWEDATGIRADFRGGKAIDFGAQFSDHQPSERVTLGGFKKLRPGMTVEEVKKVLGPETNRYGGGLEHRGGIGPFLDPLVVPLDTELLCWYKMTRITVQFRDGKVSGHLLLTIDVDRAK